jgi:anaerobic dimethyl sulfoxide reductase subunit B (iron-sulfur subunit)
MMAQNGILVDNEFCTGCYSCEIACQAEHDLHLNQWGIKVMQLGPWPIRDGQGKETDEYVYDFVPAFTKLCDLCAARTAAGKLPSCVHHCQAAILKYGPVEELAKELEKKPWQYLVVPPAQAR